MNRLDRFVRVPTQLLESLFQSQMGGGSYRVLLWVIRHTYGWNRLWAPFTWYRIAQDISMSRPAAYRVGQQLLAMGLLTRRQGELALQIERSARRQLPVPPSDVVSERLSSLPASNASVATMQPMRCRSATLFRRAKDSSKDNIKKKEKKHAAVSKTKMHLRHGTFSERQSQAGAAKPIPGKYDCVSEN